MRLLIPKRGVTIVTSPTSGKTPTGTHKSSQTSHSHSRTHMNWARTVCNPRTQWDHNFAKVKRKSETIASPHIRLETISQCLSKKLPNMVAYPAKTNSKLDALSWFEILRIPREYNYEADALACLVFGIDENWIGDCPNQISSTTIRLPRRRRIGDEPNYRIPAKRGTPRRPQGIRQIESPSIQVYALI